MGNTIDSPKQTEHIDFDLLHQIFPSETINPAFEPVSEMPRYKPARAQIDPDRTKTWFKRIFPVLYSHKVLIISALLASFCAMLLNVSVPKIVANALDFGLIAQTRPILPYFYMLLGIGISHGILVFISRYTLARITYSLDYDLRTIIFSHLIKLPFSFYDRIQSGQLISRANSDIRSIETFLTSAPNVVQTLLTFLFALTIMLSMHVGLTLVAMLTLPFVYILSSRVRKVMFPLSWLNQSRVADVTTIVDENINGVRVVKSFAAEIQQIRLLADAAERLRWSRIQMVKLRARFMPFIANLPRVGFAMVLLYGGYLAIGGNITIGELVAFNSYGLMIMTPFRMFANLLIQYERARASAQRIFEILDERSDIVDSPNAIDLENPQGDIEFQDVAFGYADNALVLDELNLRIKPGEAVAIVGRTGSGKSTLIRLIPRFYDVSRGIVTVDGYDVRELSLVSLRACIGIVFDDPFIFSSTIKHNIAYGRPDATMEEVVQAAKIAHAHEFIIRLAEGYDSIVGERGYTLSGGQRQRIGIARTLLINPKILVLDDATSSVDVQVEEKIHNNLKQLMEHRTTIIIAHRLSTILLADRVVLIDKGRIIASGSHTDLMSREPRYVEVLASVEKEGIHLEEQNMPGRPDSGRIDESSIEAITAEDLLPPDADLLGGNDP